MMSEVDVTFKMGQHGNGCAFQAPESFYADASQFDDHLTFDDMNLSRPILKVGTYWCCLNQKKNKMSLVE